MRARVKYESLWVRARAKRRAHACEHAPMEELVRASTHPTLVLEQRFAVGFGDPLEDVGQDRLFKGSVPAERDPAEGLW